MRKTRRIKSAQSHARRTGGLAAVVAARIAPVGEHTAAGGAALATAAGRWRARAPRMPW